VRAKGGKNERGNAEQPGQRIKPEQPTVCPNKHTPCKMVTGGECRGKRRYRKKKKDGTGGGASDGGLKRGNNSNPGIYRYFTRFK